MSKEFHYKGQLVQCKASVNRYGDQPSGNNCRGLGWALFPTPES
jgi:hypothetical protein